MDNYNKYRTYLKSYKDATKEQAWFEVYEGGNFRGHVLMSVNSTHKQIVDEHLRQFNESYQTKTK